MILGAIIALVSFLTGYIICVFQVLFGDLMDQQTPNP